MTTFAPVCLVLAVWGASLCRAWACSVPVCRYALEFWPAESYAAIVFHRGPLDAEAQKAVNALRSASQDQKAPANLRLELVNVELPLAEPTRQLWLAQSNAPLPWVMVRYPEVELEAPLAWAGPLETGIEKVLIDSPARRELIRRLLQGESVVWLLLECGRRSDDDAAAQLLADNLRKIEQDARLPSPEPDDSRLQSALPLRIAFSILRVSRADPAERILVRLLLRGEKELENCSQPVAFPVFGRGRVLAALTGKGLTPMVVAEACAFLTSDCSCEVKAMNPGRDLLLAADWESVVNPQSGSELEHLALPRGAGPGQQSVRTPKAANSESYGESTDSQGRLWRRIFLTAGFLVVILVAGSGAILLRSRPWQ